MSIARVFGVSTVAYAMLFVAAGCRHSQSQHHENTGAGAGQPVQIVTGKVRHVDMEGGFYGIVADDGTKLDPVNLPKDFHQDGVRVQVRVVEVKDPVSAHMWGKMVRIIEIKRLQPEEGQ